MPKSKPFSRQAYWDAKNQRILVQKQAMESILKLPPAQWGEALFSRWPEGLPKVVRAGIPSRALQDWRAHREVMMQARDEEFVAMQEEMMGFMELMGEARENHDKKARELLGILLSVVGMRSLTVNAGELVFKFTDENGWGPEEILDAISLALDSSGGITARQVLRAAKTRQSDGTLTQAPQERVYGFFCIGGQWGAVSADQMRHAYTHTPDGRPLPPDPGTSFGDARDLVPGGRDVGGVRILD